MTRSAPTRHRSATTAELDALTMAVAERELEAVAGVDDPAAQRSHAALVRRLVDAPPPARLVRLWWQGLSEAAKTELARHAPLAVGNLDGVPWPARVAANHRTLDAHLRTREGTAPRRPTKRQRLVSERLGLLATGAGVVDREGRPRFLLAVDPERDAIVEYVGHAIADTDDPFASPLAPGVDALALFVPGNDSDLAQFEGKAHSMSELVHAATPGTTGLVVWQGGHFPRGPRGLNSSSAVRLARRFGHFVNAIPRDPAVRYAALGFSFGGSVVGSALRLGMRVDAVVHIASAGLGPGIRRLDELGEAGRVPHVALMAPGDTAVGPTLGLDLPRGTRGIGHGGNPLADPRILRLETGFRLAPEGASLEGARSSGVLRGHATVLETWHSTAKRNLSAALRGGRAEEAAPRSRLELIAERLAWPRSPIQSPSYTPRWTSLPGPDAPTG